MFRAFQAVLQPTGHQAEALTWLLGAQRELYNAALEERIGAWRRERRSVSRFDQRFTYKAEEAGREVIAVNPRHTSETCHRCGHVDAENRPATQFRCTRCGQADHADINAARNILRAGLAHRYQREANDHDASLRDLFEGGPLSRDVLRGLRGPGTDRRTRRRPAGDRRAS